jgi:hypothetical protein
VRARSGDPRAHIRLCALFRGHASLTLDASHSSCSHDRMSTVAPTHPDAVAAFNSQLALAKLSAIRILQDLMSALSHPDSRAGRGGAAIRELRHVATTILRAQPFKAPARAADTTPQIQASQPAMAPTPSPAATASRTPAPSSPTDARRLSPLHPTSVVAKRLLRAPTRARRGNPDVMRLLSRRTAVGAPAP